MLFHCTFVATESFLKIRYLKHFKCIIPRCQKIFLIECRKEIIKNNSDLYFELTLLFKILMLVTD